MENKIGEKFWNIFGKISAVIFVVAAIITAYFQIYQDKSELSLDCLTNDVYQLSPDLLLALDKLEKSLSTDSIKKYILEYDPMIEKRLDELYWFSLNIKERILKDDIRFLFMQRLSMYSYVGYSHFQVFNEGKIPSEDIVISFPTRGVALVVKENGEEKVFKFNGELRLDELRQKEKIDIKIWGSNKLTDYDLEKVKISDKSGVGSVIYGVKVRGILKFIELNKFLIGYFAASIPLLFWIIYLLFPRKTKN